MAEKTEQGDWMLQVLTSDCAGALTGVAAAFSNEGINIRTITGHGACPDHKGIIDVVFESDEASKDVLVRKIKRLTKVVGVHEMNTGARRSS